MSNAHEATRHFERALCVYTGAPYAVAVNSCTMALLLAVAWRLRKDVPEGHGAILGTRQIEIPKRTYVSVPMSILHAGGRPTFRDEPWLGSYQLRPLPVWDCARWFSGDMFNDWRLYAGAVGGTGPRYQCVSFHTAKTLGDTQGGAILHDDAKADTWLRRARFDGRAEGVPPGRDLGITLGWHCYMSPDVATRLLWKLSFLPKHNDPIPEDGYPDLSLMEIFK